MRTPERAADGARAFPPPKTQAAPEAGAVARRSRRARPRPEHVGAVVNRQGELCVTVVSTDDPAAASPGSQAIARAKAYTANAFSTDTVPLSTARLYTLSQPGHSLRGRQRGSIRSA